MIVSNECNGVLPWEQVGSSRTTYLSKLHDVKESLKSYLLDQMAGEGNGKGSGYMGIPDPCISPHHGYIETGR